MPLDCPVHAIKAALGCLPYLLKVFIMPKSQKVIFLSEDIEGQNFLHFDFLEC